MILVNTPPAQLTVKAQVYTTGLAGVAHAYHAGVRFRWYIKDVSEGKVWDVLF